MVPTLKNLDNKFVDNNIPYITISNVNNIIVPTFDEEGVAKKCEEKGKRCDCQWTGKTADDIIKMWKEKATISMEYGKKVDSYAEVLFEGSGYDVEEYLLDNDVDYDKRLKTHITAFDQFYNRIMKSGDVEYYGREIEVWNLVDTGKTKFYIKGRLDALFYNKRTDTWIIVDWKSNEKITTTHNKWTEHLLGPAKDLYNIDWNTYTLQVLNYKAALLQNYLPDGADSSHVQCMIVNLPQAEYDNDDAVLGKGETYKAYLPSMKYDRAYLDRIFEYAFKKNELNKKRKN